MIALKTHPQKENTAVGQVRPIHVRRDSRQIVRLLEIVFHQRLQGSGRRAVAPTSSFFSRLLPNTPVPGFVYERDKKIVGNVSLLDTGKNGRFLVANVAVHPDYRRQGIARRMMSAVVAYTQDRGADRIVLQVEEKNHGAVHLYQSLGFKPVGTMNVWQLSHYSLRDILVPPPLDRRRPDRYRYFHLRPLRGRDWRTAYRLDEATFHPEMNWPEPIDENSYRTGLRSWWHSFVTGRQQEVWVAEANNQLIGLGVIGSEWARPYKLKVRVLPDWRDKVSRPLVGKLVRRLRQYSRRPIQIDHPKDDTITHGLLQEAGFSTPRRILTTMCYDHAPR